ncbi:PLP-dependent transferase [Starkeya sp. ORNL1]|uniref:PLP-dependent transferase n=1 Tax=Starkeya sp. ORNL1 TaxID=2709380 RepID=UPI002484B3BF|nr:PLP-dependent transferase [Starkeya sp. ORNL1]
MAGHSGNDNKNKSGGHNGPPLATATEIVVAGRDPARFDGFVNVPVVRGSTVLSPTVADMEGHTGRYSYGRRGSPTLEGLETALTKLEGGAGVVLTPSGLSAVRLSSGNSASAGSPYGSRRHVSLSALPLPGQALDATVGDGVNACGAPRADGRRDGRAFGERQQEQEWRP